MIKSEFKPNWRCHPSEHILEAIENGGGRTTVDDDEFELLNRVMHGGYYDSNEARTLSEIVGIPTHMLVNLQNNYLVHKMNALERVMKDKEWEEM